MQLVDCFTAKLDSGELLTIFKFDVEEKVCAADSDAEYLSEHGDVVHQMTGGEFIVMREEQAPVWGRRVIETRRTLHDRIAF